MIVFPNCKINLGLHILQKRSDGYHNIETVFYPVALCDALEIIEYPGATDVGFSISGLQIDGNASENICVKAYQILKKDFPHLPLIKMHLHKVIPSGAGLGGGSANAAFTLMLLNKKFSLNLEKEQLLKYALQLGSDCPFFIRNAPCFAKGRGEEMEEISIDLSDYKIILVHPGIHISTAWAFSQLQLKDNKRSLKEVIGLPLSQWKEKLENDFEEVAFTKHPELKK